MNTIVNLFVKFSGMGWVWDKLDGSKTYLASAVSILTGAAGVITELLPAINAHDAGAALAIAKHLPADPAWLMLVGGVAALGLGHKADKIAEAAAAQPPAPTSQTP